MCSDFLKKKKNMALYLSWL